MEARQVLAVVQCSVVLGACSAGFGKKWQTIPRTSDVKVQEVGHRLSSEASRTTINLLTFAVVLHELSTLRVVAWNVQDQRRAFPSRTDGEHKTEADIPGAGRYYRCVDGGLFSGSSPAVQSITSVVARWPTMPRYSMCDQAARRLYRGTPMLTEENVQGPSVDRNWRV